jgi:endonuclease/exonuclease/phosphatase family metal-dependent hydrolase
MIRLMTYNIRGTIGMDNQHSAERIADVIRESGAQIVCLQEVHSLRKRTDHVDQPAVLGNLLGMHVAFQRNYREGAGGLGNAILTDLDLWQTRSHILTSTGEQRGIIEVSIRTPDGPLAVFCTHFGLDSKERMVQAGELAALVNAAQAPRIACGDFNGEAKEPAIAELITSGHLIDADAGGPLTFDSERPHARIDLILHDPSIRVLSTSVPSTMASDHLPLIADLELPK